MSKGESDGRAHCRCSGSQLDAAKEGGGVELAKLHVSEALLLPDHDCCCNTMKQESIQPLYNCDETGYSNMRVIPLC